MTEMESKRSHFRGKARTGRRMEIRFRIDENGELSDEHTAYTKNIGVGGAFILTTDPPPPGSHLKIRLAVPVLEGPLDVDGEVRWIVDGKLDEPETDHGMGVRFDGLDVDQILVLNDYFSTLTDTVDHDEV
jgi:uncharacterized protein (TIGR02266 family)